jgi:hypothetical protein
LSRDRAEEIDEEEEEGAVETQRRGEGRITERKGIGSILFHACICCNIMLLYIQRSLTTSS